MATSLTSDDFRLSLTDYVAAKAADAREKYGPVIDRRTLQLILEDRSLVRYPCQLVFSEDGLQPGETAFPFPLGDQPEVGFHMLVHPYFQFRSDAVAALVLYQLVQVNYGEFASPIDAETFGAGVLGMDREAYYQFMCDLADELVSPSEDSGCGSGECGCG